MTKFIRLSFLTLITTHLLHSQAWSQEQPSDPSLSPVLTNIELNDIDSKELFDVLRKWKLTVTDRQSQTKKIQASEVNCVENMEGGRQVGCSLFDELHERDLTKYNKNADPLFKELLKHIIMECEEDSETCILAAEKMGCTLSANKYVCSIEILTTQKIRKFLMK